MRALLFRWNPWKASTAIRERSQWQDLDSLATLGWPPITREARLLILVSQLALGINQCPLQAAKLETPHEALVASRAGVA